MRRFVGRAVKVTTANGVPTELFWDSPVRVVEVLSEVDCPDLRSDWRLRRHHRQLLVRTAGNLILELHQDRTGRWTLYATDDGS